MYTIFVCFELPIPFSFCSYSSSSRFASSFIFHSLYFHYHYFPSKQNFTTQHPFFIFFILETISIYVHCTILCSSFCFLNLPYYVLVWYEDCFSNFRNFFSTHTQTHIHTRTHTHTHRKAPKAMDVAIY